MSKNMEIKSSKAFGFDILIEIKAEDDAREGYGVEAYESGDAVKEQGKRYTDNALILQSILRYSDKAGSKYFTSRELIEKHLISDCKVYIEKYSGFDARTNIKSRVENINPRIVEALDRLSYLELVKHKPHTAKNGEETKMYMFTQLGQMIRTLLPYDDLDNNNISENNDKQFYTQAYGFYESLEHVHAKFCLVFFKNCLSKGKFGVVVAYLANLLAEASNDKHEFLSQIKFLNLLYWDKCMAEIYEESLHQLSNNDPTAWNIVMLNTKLLIEETQESKARFLWKFEKERHDMMSNTDMVVLEGHCNTCGSFFIVSMRTVGYLKDLAESSALGTHLSKVVCESCKKDRIDFQSFPN